MLHTPVMTSITLTPLASGKTRSELSTPWLLPALTEPVAPLTSRVPVWASPGMVAAALAISASRSVKIVPPKTPAKIGSSIRVNGSASKGPTITPVPSSPRLLLTGGGRPSVKPDEVKVLGKLFPSLKKELDVPMSASAAEAAVSIPRSAYTPKF